MIFNTWPWQHWRAERRDAVALRTSQESFTWQQLCERVDALAAGFYQQGVREGAGVALCAKNSPQAVFAWLALLQCGARVLPLNPQLPAPLLAQLVPALSLEHALVCGEALPPPGLPLLAWHEEGDCVHAAGWQPERFASMTLTSGSTGLPKAAVHSAAAHLASAAGVLGEIPFAGGDCWLLSLPLYHVSGQGIFWRWLLAGASLATRESQPLAQALAGCTHASLVPTQLWRLLKEKVAIPSLKAVLLGGAAIPVELTEAADQRGIACWCGYGLTEFASTVCAKKADGRKDVGFALAGREVKIVNGEIWLRGASMAAGYWRDGGVQPLTNREGWFATRDRGVWLGDRLCVPGRLDNLFFSGGEGIQPEEVERVIAAHPQVRQAFVVPLEDKEFGHRPVAVVECEEGAPPEALALWVRDKLARFQQPVRWLALPESIKNGGIKISRRQLSQWVVNELSPFAERESATV